MNSAEEIFGTWLLYEWAYDWGKDLPIYDEDPYKGEVKFLADFKGHDLQNSEKISGAEIVINEGGCYFRGKGKRPLLSFGHDGVQVQGAAEFIARLEVIGGKAFVKIDNSDLTDLEGKVQVANLLRCSRSDFSLLEYFSLERGSLVRTTVAVTDGIYGDVIIQKYKKQSGSLLSAVKRAFSTSQNA